MPIPINTILNWSRVANNRRAAVINELIPGGLDDLALYTPEEVKEATKSFRTNTVVAQRFSLSANSTKRLMQLLYWVKDRVRLGQAVEFDDATDQLIFVAAIEAAEQRQTIRRERKKNTEGLATLKVDPPLKSSAGWESWGDSIKAALTVAYGSKGVPLLYVIRDDPIPNFLGGDWEEIAVNAAPHVGLDYEADKKTVHLFILNNVFEDSDAHAYIHPIILRNDGRQDWITLNNRYENDATIQARVNQANKTWNMLVYKNKRAMTFEAFSKKLTKAIQHFAKAGRPKHDGDVIDWIWSHVQNGELTQHLAALKVGQSFNVRTSREILQEIAKEIPNLSKGSNFQPRISEMHQTEDYTFDGDAPNQGVHTADGKLFCGSYSPTRWFSDEMKQFRDQIIKIRNKHGTSSGKNKGGGRGKGRPVPSHVTKAKRKIQQLKKKNDDLTRKLSSLKTPNDDKQSKSKDKDNAGDAFGGKSSMKKE
jgi:hypothetical protein